MKTVWIIIPAVQTLGKSSWLVRLVTLGLAAGLAYSAVAWIQAWRAVAYRTPSSAAIAGAAPPLVDSGAVAGALGVASQQLAQPAAALMDQRMRLLGVVAGGREQGVALIALDGKAPKPYAVGAQVTDGLLLQRLMPRSAELGPAQQGPASVTLELPALARPQTAASAPLVASPLIKRRRGNEPGSRDTD